jgi:hypothetical protein
VGKGHGSSNRENRRAIGTACHRFDGIGEEGRVRGVNGIGAETRVRGEFVILELAKIVWEY